MTIRAIWKQNTAFALLLIGMVVMAIAWFSMMVKEKSWISPEGAVIIGVLVIYFIGWLLAGWINEDTRVGGNRNARTKSVG